MRTDADPSIAVPTGRPAPALLAPPAPALPARLAVALRARLAVAIRSPQLTRLVRYAVSGAASALTHFTIGLAGVHLLHLHPVIASTTGFIASIAVSYLLQRAWVFRSGTAHATAGARFLIVTAVAFTINTAVLWFGTELLAAPYPVVQPIALSLIPLINYSLNSRWTFPPGD